jgi:phosphatidylinositol alpha-mannosyltransferase
MKIALVSPYDFAYPGGVTAHIGQLAQEFNRQGHEAWIIAPSSKPGNAFEFDRFVRLGVPVPVPAGGSVARLSLSPWLLRSVRTLLEREQFDVIHLHEPLTPLLPWLVLHCSNSINIGTFHAYSERSKKAATTLVQPTPRAHRCVADGTRIHSKTLPGRFPADP